MDRINVVVVSHPTRGITEFYCLTQLFSGCHFIFCIFELFMLLVVFWLLLFNESIMYRHICCNYI